VRVFDLSDLVVNIVRDRPERLVERNRIKKGWGRLMGREDEW
jgi:hypothetical protein